MQHKTLTNARGTVHYWTNEHTGEPILFTHGATMEHGMFQHQMEHFASDYKVISWDVPLHGLSRPYKDFSLQHATDDLIQVLDAEGIAQAHLVGQSMGGYIIQIAALHYPDRVRSLVPVDSSPIQLSYYSNMDRWLLSITPFLLRLYPYNYLIKTIATQIALDKSVQAYALGVLKTMTTAEIAFIMDKVYKGLLTYEQEYRLPCPLLIVYGDRDRSGRVVEYCKRWAKLEDRELKVIPNAAHNSNQDNPIEFNRVLEEFLTALSTQKEIKT
jgi:pimeloyl-ACP methyl ester carboxylesterase